MAAWGNALGGYKRQRRAANGRFGSGGGRAARQAAKIKRNRAHNAGIAKSYPAKRYNSTLKEGATFKEIWKDAGAGARHNKQYAKGAYAMKTGGLTTKSIQSRHRKALAANIIGTTAGQVAGTAIARQSGGSLDAVAISTSVGRMAGSAVGVTVANRRGWTIRDAEYNKMSRVDRAALHQRERRVARVQLGANVAATAYGVHSGAKQLGLYGHAAGKIQNTRNARANAKMDARSANMGFAKRGRFSGAYNVTTAKKPRRGYRTSPRKAPRGYASGVVNPQRALT